MNDLCYRIVFNRTRGILMVVAETATSAGKAASGQAKRTSPTPFEAPSAQWLRLARTAVAIAVASLSTAYGQIRVNTAAPKPQQPVILSTANNLPLIGIQTPSAAGVSRNSFTQFDVGKGGAVLNNARTNALTKLSGWVPANPMLAGGSARVILNEVRSTSPSTLAGFLEVAGGRAEVVIANPAGIVCSGCGFVNASKATLATGTPNFSGAGDLLSFSLGSGVLSIQDMGLNSSTADSTVLLSRSVNVSAGVWAKELLIASGAGDLTPTGIAAPTQNTPAPSPPAFGIDVAQVGGMYAGAITLVATEAGIGVRNAGEIMTSTGKAAITSQGGVSNAGRIVSSGDIDINTGRSLSNTGVVYAQGGARIQVEGQADNSGLIAARSDASIAATGGSGTLTSGANSVLAAGVQPDGSISGAGQLSIAADAGVLARGQLLAAGQLKVSSPLTDLQQTQVSADSVQLTSTAGDLTLQGARIGAVGVAELRATQAVRLDRGGLSANHLLFDTSTLSNVEGFISSLGSDNLSIVIPVTLDNTRGTISAAGTSFTINAAQVVNTQGSLQHSGTGQFSINTESIDADHGLVGTNGLLTASLGTARLTSARVFGDALNLKAVTMANDSGQIVQTGTSPGSIAVDQLLGNKGGVISSMGDLHVSAATLTNAGGAIQTIGAAGLNVLVSGSFDNSSAGLTMAGGAASITASSLLNGGGQISATGNIGVQLSRNLDNTKGEIATAGLVSITAAAIGNAHGSIRSTADGVTLKAAGAIDSEGGSILAARDLAINAGTLSNSGAIYAGGGLTVNVAGTLANQGTLAARGNTSVASQTYTGGSASLIAAGMLPDGSFGTVGAANLAANGKVVSQASRFSAPTRLAIRGTEFDGTTANFAAASVDISATAGDLLLDHAVIAASDTASLSTSGSLQANNANIEGGRLAITAASLSNIDGRLAQLGSSNLSLAFVGNVDNTRGQISINASDLTVSAAQVLNTGGTIQHAGNGDFRLSATKLDGSGGTVVSNGHLNLAATDVIVDGGLTAAEQVGISAVRALSNRAGQIVQSGAMPGSISAGTNIDNTSGTISSNGNLTLFAASLINSNGLINAPGASSVALNISGTFANDAATVTAGGSLSISTTGINNHQGQLASGTALTLNSPGALDNSLGTVASGRSLDLRAALLDNTLGLVQSGADSRLLLSGSLSNTQGNIYSAASLDLSAAAISNTGSIFSSSDLTVVAQGRLANSGGIASQSNATITAAQLTGTSSSLFVAGLRPDLTLGQSGDLQLTGNQSVAVNGQSMAAGALTVSAPNVDLSGSSASAVNVSLFATNGLLRAAGAQLAASGTLLVKANADPSQGLDISNGKVSAADLDLQLFNLLNEGGDLRQTGPKKVAISLPGEIRNAGGQIIFNAGDVDLSAARLDNSGGVVAHAGGGTLKLSTPTLDGAAGKLASNGSLVMEGGAINSDGGLILASSLSISAETLSNQKGQIYHLGSAPAGLTLSSTFDNTEGLLASNGILALSAGQISNHGGAILTTGAAFLQLTTAGLLDNSRKGTVTAGGVLSMSVGSVSNAGGTLQTSDQFTLTTTGSFDNTGGLSVGRKNLAITAARFDNSSGIVSSTGGDASLQATADVLHNSAGRIEALGTVTVQAVGATNAAGSIVGRVVSIDTRLSDFDNSTGAVAAAGDLTITSGVLNNTQGLLQSGGNLLISTSGQRLTNTNSAANGGILAGQAATLQVGELLNQAGAISSNADLRISGTTVSNAGGGLFSSQTSVGIVAAAISNNGGQIQSLGGVDLRADGGTVSNKGGSVRSSGTLSINADSIDNTGTNTGDLGLQAKAITLTARQVLNGAGFMSASDSFAITAPGVLDNASGVISSAGTLAIADPSSSTKTLSITNTGGLSIAGKQLTVDALSESGDGQLVSLGGLDLRLASDHSITGSVQALGDANLIISGALTNQGRVTSAGLLSVQSSSVDNAASGEVAADRLEFSTVGTFVNRGLIDGSQTYLAAAAVQNLGTGRIYGNHLSIKAGELSNLREAGMSPVIGARARLDLGIGTLNNTDGALVFSNGDIHIGGSLDADRNAVGQAQTISNSSARIEALGDASIATVTLNNLNPRFATQNVVTDSSTKVDFQFCDKCNIYTSPPARQDNSGVDGLAKAYTPEGASDDFLRYEYAHTVTETQVKTTDPGQILAGGGIKFTVDQFLNDKSNVMAGSSISGVIGSLVNTDVQGQRLTTDLGTVSHYYRNKKKGSDDQGLDVASYTPAPTLEAITLYPTIYLANTAPDSTGASVPGATGTQVSQSVSDTKVASAGQVAGAIVEVRAAVLSGNVGNLGAVVNATAVVAGLNASSVSGQGTTSGAGAVSEVVATAASSSAGAVAGTGVDTAGGGTSGASSTPLPTFVIRSVALNLKVPSNSLFQVNTSPTANYVVVTDSRFTDYSAWLSTDYFLQLLGIDPSTLQLRIGDGFYEQKLVREQIAELTGRRLLPGYANDQEQFKALMAAGAAFAKQMNIRPGIALSPELMAKLTTDIVWLEKTSVTLPDGRVLNDVYVPKVYTRVREGSVTGAGGIVSGGGIDLTIGRGLLNSAATFAADRINLSTKDLVNTGRITALDVVSLQASNRLVNEGGTIDAGKLLYLSGGDVDVWSLVRQTSSAQGNRTGIFKPASLYVDSAGGALIIDATNINLRGVDVTTPGQIQLNSESGTKIGSVLTDLSNMIRFNGSNWMGQASLRTVGSNLQSGGPLTITSKGNVDITGSSVATKGLGSLQVVSGGSINVSAGIDKQTFDSQFTKKESSFLSKTKTTTITQREVTTPLMSTVSGHTTLLSAKQNVTIGGGFVVSTAGTVIDAGGDVVIEAARGSFIDRSVVTQSRTGLLAGGPTGFTFGKSKSVTDSQTAGTTLTPSQVDSVLGDVIISARGKTRVMASNVMAPNGTVAISASGIEILSGETITESVYKTQFKQSGITIGSPSGALDAVNNFRPLVTAIQKTADDPRMLAMGTYAAVQKGMDTANNIDGMIKKVESGKAQLTLGVTFGTSSSSSLQVVTSKQVVPSSVSGVNIILDSGTGALNIVGSSVKASQDAVLRGGVINLRAAEETTDSSQFQKSSNASLGVTASTDGSWGVTLSGGVSNGRGNQRDSRWKATTVEAGGKLSLISVGDMNVEGSTASGNQVMVRVGGDLVIKSLQDSSMSSSSSSSKSASITVNPTSVSGDLNLSRSSFKSDYKSVTQYAGIMAGNGGFDVEAGKIKLVGAVIASTGEAQQAGRNRIVGELTSQDILNTSSYGGMTMSFGVSSGRGGGGGFASQSGNGASQTKPCTTLTDPSCVVGNLNPNALPGNPSSSKVLDRLEAESLITKEFGATATKAFADYAGAKSRGYLALAEAYQKAGYLDEAKAYKKEAEIWAESGSYRILGEALIGGLAGGLPEALGAATSAWAATRLNAVQDDLAGRLERAGLGTAPSVALAKTLISAAVATGGGAVGSLGFVAGASNVDSNNRQLHADEQAAIKKLSAGDPKLEVRLWQAACSLTQCFAEFPPGSDKYTILKSFADEGAGDAEALRTLKNQAGLFGYSRWDAAGDYMTMLDNKYYKGLTRTVGAVNVGVGVAEVGLGAGIATTTATACAVAEPCGLILAGGTVIGGLVFYNGTATMLQGAQTIVGGTYAPNQFLETLKGAGMSESAANWVQAGLTLGAGGVLVFEKSALRALEQRAASTAASNLGGQTKSAFEIASEGGKNSGLLKNYAGKPVEEIEKGVISYEKQIALHREKIANPEKAIPNFSQLDPRQQQALLTEKWPSDIQRLQEQADVLRGILNGKRP